MLWYAHLPIFFHAPCVFLLIISPQCLLSDSLQVFSLKDLALELVVRPLTLCGLKFSSATKCKSKFLFSSSKFRLWREAMLQLLPCLQSQISPVSAKTPLPHPFSP